jgi:Protein of unknown function (DUF2442)
MKNPPAILAVRVLDGLTLELDWNTKETLRIDLASVVRDVTAFAPLQTPAVFGQVHLDDWGHALEWPNGLDMGADRLYELGREQAGLPTASQFNAWMAQHHLSLTDAANALGMTRRMMAYYRTGSRPIPKVVMLACKGWGNERGAMH